jgi:4-hydroxythreonine-4-phosphate dehydrogenase
MDALDGTISAVVTLPVNKEACRFAEPDFSGHTDYIAELCESPSVTMMLASEELIVTHVSTHVSLGEAIARVTHDRVLEVLRLTQDAVSKLRSQVRIAVAGLNPHAGEGNAFGTEDSTIIAPAIAAARKAGIDAHGPEPADTVFYNTVHKKRFEAVVCMYHDQGHIPMKTLDFDGGVNVTLGLPIIRTSVDHGTAYDIAYQGIARLRSFRLAVEMAQTMGASR